MAFQSTINNVLASGVVGELAFDSPNRGKPYLLNSAAPANNVVGRYFTVSAEGVAIAGGTGAIAGILANPKAYASAGLTPNTTVANGVEGEFISMGEIFVNLGGVANIGDAVTYNVTTGLLGSVAQVVATGAISTTTLTVSGSTGGNTLGVGSPVYGVNVAPGTVITALGTGTGGNGTYTVNISQTAASGAITSPGNPPAGTAFVPNAKVTTYAVGANGLGAITLTN